MQQRWVVAMMVVVEKEMVCLLMSCMCCSQQMPLTWLSIKTQQSLTNILAKILVIIVSLYIRQALDPHLRHGVC